MPTHTLTHDCGVPLTTGDHDTYSTHTERVMWQGTAHCFDGECPACGKQLTPEEDRIFISGH